MKWLCLKRLKSDMASFSFIKSGVWGLHLHHKKWLVIDCDHNRIGNILLQSVGNIQSKKKKKKKNTPLKKLSCDVCRKDLSCLGLFLGTFILQTIHFKAARQTGQMQRLTANLCLKTAPLLAFHQAKLIRKNRPYPTLIYATSGIINLYIYIYIIQYTHINHLNLKETPDSSKFWHMFVGHGVSVLKKVHRSSSFAFRGRSAARTSEA